MSTTASQSPCVAPALAASKPALPHFLPAPLLAMAALLAYLPILSNEFIRYDDPPYITENPYVLQGVTVESLRAAFSSLVVANWHPVTMLSHMLDVTLFGVNPRAHHAVSLALHALNAFLLYLALLRCTQAQMRSLAVALLFAVHPIHVESVAWASQRKDLLSFAFAMLTILAYKNWLDRRTLPRYLLILAAYALAFMSKPTVITLPLALLLLDFWPLNRSGCHGSASELTRAPNQPTPSNPPPQNHEPTTQDNPFSSSPSSAQDAARKTQDDLPPTSLSSTPDPGLATRDSSFLPALKNYLHLLPRLVIEKAPLFLISVLGSILVYHIQSSSMSMVANSTVPFPARLANALFAYVRYLGKLVFPQDLALIYPHPIWWPAGYIAGSAVLLLALTALLFFLALRFDKRYLPVGWLWFLGVLVPMIGIVQVGTQALADRYAYIPFIGLYVLLVWSIADFARHRFGSIPPRTAVLLLGAIAAVLASQANLQARRWKSTESIMSHTIQATGDNSVAQLALANALNRQDRYQEAIPHFLQAIRLEPSYTDAYINLGTAYLQLAQLDDAQAMYEKAMQMDPDMPEPRISLALVHNSRGVALAKSGQYPAARESFLKALFYNPHLQDAQANLARVDQYLK